MTDRSLASFLEAIRLPLADLLLAAADWLSDAPDDLAEEATDDSPEAKWVANDRGGFDPA